jgi:hypothetical protein
VLDARWQFGDLEGVRSSIARNGYEGEEDAKLYFCERIHVCKTLHDLHEEIDYQSIQI